MIAPKLDNNSLVLLDFPEKLPSLIESSDVDLLQPEFRENIVKWLEVIGKSNFDVRVANTIRGPAAQAKLYCSSRTADEIVLQRELIKNAGAPTLASLLNPDWAMKNQTLTLSLPGNSFHQWGLALDWCVVVDTLRH